ncbi:MAG: citrate/2-methylcitrate synthase [Halofilum sp. (in: g-proteobacteria)]|nr:citrate/2-methylcitrate synthase [Halofilum sp. (in: g-proteobacteria)]
MDFYSGIILRAMGIPLNMFTVIFAMARTVGWIAHWNEMMEDPELRIGRPRQLYTGPEKRDYTEHQQAVGRIRGNRESVGASRPRTRASLRQPVRGREPAPTIRPQATTL